MFRRCFSFNVIFILVSCFFGFVFSSGEVFCIECDINTYLFNGRFCIICFSNILVDKIGLVLVIECVGELCIKENFVRRIKVFIKL